MGSLDESSAMVAQGWAALDKSGILQPYQFKLREVGPEDILIKVLYCGVCHTDLHQTRDDYGMSKYPMVPGHEVTGLVSKVGEKIKNLFSEGDRVGVGCIVGACGDCNACCEGMEHYCNKRIWTYNDVYHDGNPTQGGFANYMVVNHKFVIRIPECLRLDEAAPLLCAGSTVYSPMKFNNFTSMEECKGKTCGILGLGGVGHIGVKIAKAFGLHVTVISSSPNKRQEAIEVLGADSFLISSDEKQMKEAEQTLDFILDTVPSVHPLEPYLSLLKLNGKLIIVGVPPGPLQFIAPLLILGRRSITGSFIGSIKETQEVLDVAAKKEVRSMIEVVSMEDINKAMERLEKNDVRYRFVVNVGDTIEK